MGCCHRAASRFGKSMAKEHREEERAGVQRPYSMYSAWKETPRECRAS